MKSETNPNNPNNSPIVQALLDMKANSFPKAEIDSLLLFYENSPISAEEADKEFNQHQYPDDNLTFCKATRELEYCRYLSSDAVKVLNVLIQNMNTQNNIEMSISDIKLTGNLPDKRATKALHELRENGCIAVRLNRNKIHGTIYMVNPKIATVGKVISKSSLEHIFWRFADEDAHTVWKQNNKVKTYTRGYDKQSYHNDNDEMNYVRFNKINDIIGKDETSIAPKGTPCKSKKSSTEIIVNLDGQMNIFNYISDSPM